MDELLRVLIPSLSAPIVIILVLLLIPEKIEKWSSLLWKLLSKIKVVFDFANKRYIKHDLQSRLNDYIKKLSGLIPNLEAQKARIEWVETEITKKSFLEDDKVILRLKKNDPKDENFVRGAYYFVSTSLLHKVKRYISVAQSEAIDLYVTSEILRDQKPQIIDIYLDEFVQPILTDKKKLQYYDKYDKIHKGGLFYPLYLQELDFLGHRVFGKRQDYLIVSEIDALVNFLLKVALRQIGDESDLNFDQAYCKFAIMIIGKPQKIHNTEPYVRFIRNTLQKKKVNSIYIVGLKENKGVISRICNEVSEIYTGCHSGESQAVLHYRNGRENKKKQFFVVLRKSGIDFYQES